MGRGSVLVVLQPLRARAARTDTGLRVVVGGAVDGGQRGPVPGCDRLQPGPIVGGADALGAGIFLHSWMGTATEGCVALPASQLLQVLRWLRPHAHPVIEIGLNRELATLN